MCDSPSEAGRLDYSSLSYDVLACRVVKVFFDFFIYLDRFLILVLLFYWNLTCCYHCPFILLVGKVRICMNFLVNILALFIFPVGPVICLRIPSITNFLGEGVVLWLTTYWNGRIGVLGQNIQSILSTIWLSVIPSSVVVVYSIIQFDMLHPTLLW